MGKIIYLAAILSIALGTLDTNCGSSVDLSCNVLNSEQQTRICVVDSAKQWLGVRELTGHNDHPMIKKSMELCGLCGTCGYPWCASCHSAIFHSAGVKTTKSALAADWFRSKVVWKRTWTATVPKEYLRPGQSIGFYYSKLKRYGHISLLVMASDKRLYCYEGNTSSKGQFDAQTFEIIEQGEDRERDGDGFYAKVHSYYEIDVVSDKCLNSDEFNHRYGDYINSLNK